MKATAKGKLSKVSQEMNTKIAPILNAIAEKELGKVPKLPKGQKAEMVQHQSKEPKQQKQTEACIRRAKFWAEHERVVRKMFGEKKRASDIHATLGHDKVVYSDILWARDRIAAEKK
jgi:hypothetical protein